MNIHTVFGAGQVGLQLARVLASDGADVRLVRRSPPGPHHPGVTWMQGDATDRAFADEATRGATAVFNCANPPDYAKWDGVLEPLYTAIWDAAERANARLVQLDNLYMYGRPENAPFDEQTPMRPCSHKGELRAKLARALFERRDRGLEIAVGRASDYFGPDTPNVSVFRPDVLERIRRGGTVYVFGDPDMPHSYSYTPDVARGLALLGTHEAAAGRVWHLPVAAQLSTRELIERFAEEAGTRVLLRAVPTWALRAVGVVSPLVRAIAEMTYQWEIPYLVDDGDFRRTFGSGPTPLDEAIGATLAREPAAKAA